MTWHFMKVHQQWDKTLSEVCNIQLHRYSWFFFLNFFKHSKTSHETEEHIKWKYNIIKVLVPTLKKC